MNLASKTRRFQARSAHLMNLVASVGKFSAWLTLTTAGKTFAAILLLLLGGVLTLFIVAIVSLNRREDLSIWHKIVLEEEFTVACGDKTLADYLSRENRLFAELEDRIYAHTPPEEVNATIIHRFRKGSPADPTTHSKNWNRTFELKPEGGSATCGVLLLHGMSDSPYSLRAVGERLHREGAHVLGLRLPGHGTAPSGLLEFTRKDMDAAVKIGVRHLHEQLGDKPLFLAGYSNGGALAIHYGLETMEDNSLPKISGIVLLSPAIGVSPMAALAVWQGRIGHWLGLEKLAWTMIAAEYDPYKYNSFAVNAGDQVYRLTVEIGKHLDRLESTGKLDDFPPLLAFQSAVDATVSTPALIAGLFSRLPGDQHELVLFDINRIGQIESFVTNDPRKHLADLIRSVQKPFALTVLTNHDHSSLALEERHFERTRLTPEISDPGLTWPPGVYSLSHVAVPFSPEDPIYGNGLGPDHREAKFQIGNIVLRGEKNVIQISPVDQLRLRWNPFYPWLEERVVKFVGERTAR